MRCAYPGVDCPIPATETVTLTGVGPRSLCADHIATLERMGLHFRRLGERVPAWRQRGLARDETGAVL